MSCRQWREACCSIPQMDWFIRVVGTLDCCRQSWWIMSVFGLATFSIHLSHGLLYLRYSNQSQFHFSNGRLPLYDVCVCVRVCLCVSGTTHLDDTERERNVGSTPTRTCHACDGPIQDTVHCYSFGSLLPFSFCLIHHCQAAIQT